MTTPSSRDNGPWDDRIWHHEIHTSLGERLLYFLVEFVPFDIQQIRPALEHLITTKGLGGIRAFTLFGSSDLLIRAWLPPLIGGEVRAAVRELPCKPQVKEFVVSRIERRWYWDKEGKNQLDCHEIGVDEDKIALAQGENQEILESFMAKGAILKRDPGSDETIKFFVTVGPPAGPVSSRVEPSDAR